MSTAKKSYKKVHLARGRFRFFGYFGLTIGACFLLVPLVIMAFAVQRAWKQKLTTEWPSIKGTIIAKQLTKSRNRSADSPLTYEFFLQGKVYQSTRVAFVDSRNLTYDEWLQLADGLPSQGDVTVHYNPADPKESVLVTGMHNVTWSEISSVAGMAGFATFWMIGWWSVLHWLPDRGEKAGKSPRKKK
jgi:hypothetical protein